MGMNKRNVLVGLGLAILAACASTPESTPALDAAKAAFDAAKEDPDVLKYAAQDLDAAQTTLERAATATDVDDINTLAYVAASEVKLAEAKSQREVAEAKMDELAKVKSQVQLEVRDAELAASRSQLADLQAKETDRGTVVTLGSVLFATGRSELLPGAMQSVDRLAEYLQGNPDKTVVIEGHTDSTGSDSTNLRLSQERADAVRMALITRGIVAGRIVATGLGSSRPVASNDTAAGRQQNRRVEIIIQ